MCQGIYYQKFERKKFDYSKWLGPSSKITFDNPSLVISNHTSFLDIIVHCMRQLPSQLGKTSVAKIPLVGTVAVVCGSLFVNREDSKDKKKVQDMIIER